MACTAVRCAAHPAACLVSPTRSSTDAVTTRVPATRGYCQSLCGTGVRPLGSARRSQPLRRRGSRESGVLTTALSEYTPSPMDASLLLPQLAVLTAVAGAGAYWWFILVPSARVRLAVNKKSGKLREYLEDLKEDDSRPLERWFYANWLEKVDPETKYLLREDGSSEQRGGEGSTTSTRAATAVKLDETGGVDTGKDGDDTLEEVIRKAKKTPKFWSADNPVLVGMTISILGAMLFGGLTGNL